MLNVVAIMGRLVADPQLRQTTTGRNVASFRIACDRNRKGPDGQNQADFIDIVAWERTAEFICRYFQKGSLIAIDGRIQNANPQGAPAQSYAPAPAPAEYAPRPVEQQAPAASYSAGSNEDFALIEDDGDLPF